MNDRIISGVEVVKRSNINDERGYIQHFLNSRGDSLYNLEEIYFSIVYNGSVKAWHYHKEMSMNYFCVFGMIKLVLIDTREYSPTNGILNEFFMGEKNPITVLIPKMVWNGFKGFGDREFSIVSNATDFIHDKNEIIREHPHSGIFKDIYDWERKDG